MKKAETKNDEVFEEAVVVDEKKTEQKKEKKDSGFDFMDNNFTEKILEQETKQNTESQPKEDVDRKKEIESIKAEYENELKNTKEILTFEDCYEFADFIIESLDTLSSAGCGFFAEEKSELFEIPQKKKSKLAGMLTKVLVKRQMNLSIEVLLGVGIIMAFSEPIAKVRTIRKEKKKTKKVKKDKNESSKEFAETTSIEPAASETAKIRTIKNKGGRPKTKKT